LGENLPQIKRTASENLCSGLLIYGYDCAMCIMCGLVTIERGTGEKYKWIKITLHANKLLLLLSEKSVLKRIHENIILTVLKIQKRRTTKNSKRKHKIHKALILFALCFFVKKFLLPLWLKN